MPDWLNTHPQLLHLLARLLIACIFGGLIGWEREARGQSAGFRTHIMVALGAAGFTLMALEYFGFDEHGARIYEGPAHIVAAIVGGVGFLGAGAILQSRGEIKGLTTAAGLWVVAAVGIAAGTGLYALSLMLTLFAAATLRLARRFEKTPP
jgi:putative Mg2+ transporter-C (MgtC) family protein